MQFKLLTITTLFFTAFAAPIVYPNPNRVIFEEVANPNIVLRKKVGLLAALITALVAIDVLPVAYAQYYSNKAREERLGTSDVTELGLESLNPVQSDTEDSSELIAEKPQSNVAEKPKPDVKEPESKVVEKPQSNFAEKPKPDVKEPESNVVEKPQSNGSEKLETDNETESNVAEKIVPIMKHSVMADVIKKNQNVASPLI